MMRLLVLLCLAGFSSASALAAERPNIVFILCDDLGYGDVRCFNPAGKIATPHLDAIAARGMKFTDAHSGSSVCTPTRYGVLTGRYSWRSRLQSGVTGGLSPRLIESGRITVAAMLKEQGYRTACIGKWHLGMDWVKLPGKEVSELSIETPAQVWNVDYAQPIRNGPTSLGFEEFFGISASLDMVPYCFIQNDRVTKPPTETMKLAMNKGGGEAWTREGPGAPGFDGSQVLPEITRHAVKFIGEAEKKAPFFLYLPLNSPHTPILPSAEWRGRSGLNLYADFVMETDDAIGQVVEALEKQGLAGDTLLIVTSDNGCSPSADYPTLLAQGHNPSGSLRGHKADIYEGGHRVPFLAQWPRVIKGGGEYAHPIGLLDLMATCAEIAGAPLPANAAEDSVSFLPVLRGALTGPVREALVHHSITGGFSIRQGRWKLALCPGSGGWSDPRPGKEPAGAPLVQLFDLEADPGESRNLQAEHPEVVAKLTALLEKYAVEGRSTPGPPQANTVEPDIRRGFKAPPAKGRKPKAAAGN